MTPAEERKQWLRRTPDLVRAKKLGIWAWVATALVLILIGLMGRPQFHISLPEGISLSFLPAVHAVLNSTVALLLIAALCAVKTGRIRLHRSFMLGALACSALFLLGYVVYHFTNAETKFGDLNHDGTLSVEELAAVGKARTVYLMILLTHIVAAGISLPLILLTFAAAWTNRFEKHRRLARWVFPLWLYVALTGPICYLMLRPYYL